ncbi:aminotransferase class I/II-fold pyridoxal phosphate-dependent enzyme [Gammaproteobacteria bacterium]|nr:aminotransferase class I/II-fold pyridoxal phosphate-dependent enzyme [Gammaproteobacteria bacterium]
MEDFIRVPYGSTVHGEEEIDAVINVLKTTTQMSKNVREFESKVAAKYSKDYGIMVNSGSSALYLSIEALNLPKGSEVITPALTFGTTVASIVNNKLVPVFVDVKQDTYCIDETQIESKITENTSAIVAPDLMGNICEWPFIRELADKHNLKILVDSADTIGATYDGISTGSFADVVITSFYGSHIINGAGNGGMIATSDKKIADKCSLLRSWGRSSSLFVESEAIENRFNVHLDGIQYDAKFVFEELGYQLEPSEISAAFALIQFDKLSKNMELRNKHFNSHINFLSKYDNYFSLPIQNPKAYTCWLAFPMVVKKDAPFNRTDMQIFLEKRNIQTRVVFTGNILRQPMMKNVECVGEADDFVNADRVMKQGILLACHHGLNDEMINHLYQSIDLFIEQYT